MLVLTLSEATAALRRITVLMVDATDGYTAETGLTLTVTLSKNGAAFGAAAGSVTEVGGGVYYYQATQGELDTAGFLALKATGSGARDYLVIAQVTSADPVVVVQDAEVVPYAPESWSHALAWQTDVLKAWDGTEHRAAIRSGPRESIAAGYLLEDDQMAALRARLAFDPNGTYLMPLWHESVPLLADVVLSSTIRVDSTYLDWLAVDQAVFVVGADQEAWWSGTITAVDVSVPTVAVVTLSSRVDDMLAGVAHLMPLATMLLPDQQPVAKYRLEAGEWRTGGVLTDAVRTWGTGVTLTTYDGYTVQTKRPRGEARAEEQSLAGLRVIDYGGKVTSEWSRAVADFRRAHEFHVADAGERQYWKKFLQTVMGRRGSFLMSTWRDDLEISSQPAGVSLVVVDTPSYVTWFPSLAHRRLSLELSDGTTVYRKASAVADNLDGTHTITLTASLTATVSRISFLEICRLADDEVTVEYGSGAAGTIAFASLVVQQ